MSCVVKKCESRLGSANISFHRFPRTQPLRDLWIAAISWEDGWEPKKHHIVCSKHFPDTYFESDNKWRKVKKNAVPTLNLPFIPNQNSIPRTSLNNKSTDHLKRIAKLEKKVLQIQEIAKRRLRKINALNQHCRRLKKRNIDINLHLIDIIAKEQIKEKDKIISGWIKNNEVIERCLSQVKDDNSEFNLELKKFALTLHSLSPQSYSLVREELNDVLPHPRTISKWCQGIDCVPGFTQEAIDAIKEKVTQNNDNSSEQGAEAKTHLQTHLVQEPMSPLRSCSPDFVYHF